MVGRTFNKILKVHPHWFPWGNLLPILQNTDGVVANLETTITKSRKKWPKKAFNYKLLPQFGDTLRLGNVRFLSIANNHILDFMEEGLRDTQNNLRKLGIKSAGAGKNLLEAQEPVYLSLKGIKFAFIAAADHYDYWAAGRDTPGIWYIDTRSRNSATWNELLRVVRETRKKCDYLIVSLHWNYNYVDKINPIFKEFGRLLIRNGVDVIHGHSPHHLLEIERYLQGWIFYSLGSLVDDYAVSRKYRNDLSCLVKMSFTERSSTSLRKLYLDCVYPIKIQNYQVNIARNPSEIAIILEKLRIQKVDQCK